MSVSETPAAVSLLPTGRLMRLVHRVHLQTGNHMTFPISRASRLSIVFLAVAGGLWLLATNLSPFINRVSSGNMGEHALSTNISDVSLEPASEYFPKSKRQKTNFNYRTCRRCPTESSCCQNNSCQWGRARLRCSAVTKQCSDRNHVGSKFHHLRRPIRPHYTI